eukprot:UN10804
MSCSSETHFDCVYELTQYKTMLYIGKYPIFDDLPQGTAIIVDCTLEFPGLYSRKVSYFNAPSLDLMLATPDMLVKTATEVVNQIKTMDRHR